MLNVLDILLLVVILVSLVAGLLKGLVREIFALVGVVAGIVVATMIAPSFGDLLEEWIPYPEAAYAVAFVLVFLGVLLLSGILGKTLDHFMEFARLGFYNRFLGGLFGACRGGLIGLVAVLGLTLVLDPRETGFIRDSRITPYLAWGAQGIVPFIPDPPRALLERRLRSLPRPGSRSETVSATGSDEARESPSPPSPR